MEKSSFLIPETCLLLQNQVPLEAEDNDKIIARLMQQLEEER